MNAHAPDFQIRASELPPVNTFTRWLAAQVISKVWRTTPDVVMMRLWPHDRVTAEVISRAASAPAMTTVTGWAAELAQRVVIDTLTALGPVSAAARLLRTGLLLDFSGTALISVPGFVATANEAAWVAEGDPIPVQQMNAAPGLLNPYKVASISVLTREMIESSNAEKLISDTLIRAAGLALDAVMFDANPATTARPAGLRNGIAAIGASTSTDLYEAALADLATLVGATGAVGGPGPYVLIANPGRAVSLSMRWIGQSGVIVLGSPVVGDDIIVVAANALVGAISAAPDVEVANATTLQMSDTPVALGGAGPVRGLFQTDSIGLKVRWPASWYIRDPRGVAWLTPSWK
jgi:hypothetical protein